LKYDIKTYFNFEDSEGIIRTFSNKKFEDFVDEYYFEIYEEKKLNKIEN